MAENLDGGPLPPGWDRKYDHRTGRYYFINYFSKTTTWEDPRSRYRQFTPGVPQHVPVLESIPLQDLTNVRPSPATGRATFATPYSSPARSATAVTPATSDNETSVAKISAMFPTVSETHIRALLIKYLKSVFPKAEETLLLDILSNSENNVQKASEKLTAMGFEKRDTPPPRLTVRQKEDEQKAAEPRLATPTPPPRMKSLEEKQKMKVRLQERYQSVPERVVTIALDSVDYDEDRAAQILQIMVQEDEQKPVDAKPIIMPQPQARPTPPPAETPVVSPTPVRKASEKPLSRRLKGKKDIPKVSRGTSTTEDKEYKSSYITKVLGPNRSLQRGPNDDLLLTDYVTWNGPNPDLAKGPDRSSLCERTYTARGPDPTLREGPVHGSAKGSLFARRRVARAETEESRGK